MKNLLLTGALLLIGLPALAFDGTAHDVTLGDGVARKGLRIESTVQNDLAWNRFVQMASGRWVATWDADIGAVRRVWGSGIAAPNSSTDPRAAEIYARATLNQHVDLLAPGADPRDFRLVANVVSIDDVRSVGFVQTQQGLPVDGGQVSFRFKHDRLVVIGSEAWPRFELLTVERALTAAEAGAAAKRWVDEKLETNSTLVDVSEPIIRAVVLEDGAIRATRVRRATVRTRHPVGKWAVDIDLSNGARFAMRQTLMFTSGSIQYSVPERRPGSTRLEAPAPRTAITVDGASQRTDELGAITTTGTGTAAIVTGVVGDLVSVTNEAGANASFAFTLREGETTVWNAADDPEVDAQLTTYIATHSARDFMKALAPRMGFLDVQLPAIVNIDDTCNAFADGESINFFVGSQQCENTARLPDVVRHEYGHVAHFNAVIPGVGSFDSALSEGGADYLAATIVGDPGMGRGFFYTDEPLRHLDPVGDEAVYPEDQAGSHTTGLIYGGAMWDLRKTMIGIYGETDGARMVDEWWLTVFARASGITDAYVEVLLADDDDGNLANGTPHVCEISDAFDSHGIALGYTAGPEVGELMVAPNTVFLPVGDGEALCPSGEYVGARLTWQIRGQPQTLTEVEMSRIQQGYAAELPKIPEGEVLNYKVDLETATGRLTSWPNNPGDPMYEKFIGEVRPLYCTDFEDDPFSVGWESEMLESESRRARNEWQWGAPLPAGGFGGASGDPLEAYSGTFVVGQDLGGETSNGRYQRDKVEVLRSLAIPVGDAQGIRLQYHRWLTVEDADADQAEILAYGVPLWRNVASGTGQVHHLDREWRFHDVDLTYQVEQNARAPVQVTYSLTTNRFGSTGGWTIDDFCIVAWDGPSVVCGDGEIGEGEACDDGNQLAGDGCEVDCTPTPAPVCGNGTVEMAEVCDDGNLIDGDGCESSCIVTVTGDKTLDEVDDGCGCRTSGRGPTGGFVVALGLLASVLVRRRRSATARR